MAMEKLWEMPKDFNFKDNQTHTYFNSMELNPIQMEAMKTIFPDKKKPAGTQIVHHISSQIASSQTSCWTTINKVEPVAVFAHEAPCNTNQSLPGFFIQATHARSGVIVMPKMSGKTALAVMVAAFMGCRIKYFCEEKTIDSVLGYLKRWCRFVQEDKLQKYCAANINFFSYNLKLNQFKMCLSVGDVLIFDDFESCPSGLVELMAEQPPAKAKMILILATLPFKGHTKFESNLYHGQQQSCKMEFTQTLLSFREESRSMYKDVYNIMSSHEKLGHKILITATSEFADDHFEAMASGYCERYSKFRMKVTQLSDFDKREIQTFLLPADRLVEYQKLPVFDCIIHIGMASEIITYTLLETFFNNVTQWAMRSKTGYFYLIASHDLAVNIVDRCLRDGIEHETRHTPPINKNFTHRITRETLFPDLSKEMDEKSNKIWSKVIRKYPSK